MKSIAILIASVFAVTAFAAEPAKKEEKKVEAKPTASAPAPVKADATATKSTAAKPADKKAETTKK
jgi:hypothetical protein